MSKLAEALQGERPLLTAECLPPRHADPAAVRQLAAGLPRVLDAVVVADNPGEVRGSAMACAALLAAEGAEPVLSVVTRDRNRVALEADVLGAAALGVRGFLCLSGTHASLGDRPEAAGVFDIDSIQFSQALKAMRDEGRDFGGRPVDGVPPFVIGAVAHPYLRPMELSLLRLGKKVRAGAQFLLTQAVFDTDGLAEWLEAVRGAGLEGKLAILASILVLGSVEEAERLQARQTYGPIGEEVVARLKGASDPAAEGVALAVEAAARAKGLPGVRGIHVLCGGREAVAAQVIQEAGLAHA